VNMAAYPVYGFDRACLKRVLGDGVYYFYALDFFEAFVVAGYSFSARCFHCCKDYAVSAADSNFSVFYELFKCKFG